MCMLHGNTQAPLPLSLRRNEPRSSLKVPSLTQRASDRLLCRDLRPCGLKLLRRHQCQEVAQLGLRRLERRGAELDKLDRLGARHLRLRCARRGDAIARQAGCGVKRNSVAVITSTGRDAVLARTSHAAAKRRTHTVMCAANTHAADRGVAAERRTHLTPNI